MDVNDEIDTLDYQSELQKVCKHENLTIDNYSMIWHDGDIVCKDCGKYIRSFNGG